MGTRSVRARAAFGRIRECARAGADRKPQRCAGLARIGSRTDVRPVARRAGHQADHARGNRRRAADSRSHARTGARRADEPAGRAERERASRHLAGEFAVARCADRAGDERLVGADRQSARHARCRTRRCQQQRRRAARAADGAGRFAIDACAPTPEYPARWSSLFWSVGPSISLPIFEGGQLRANVRVAKAEAGAAALQYRQTVLGALQDVDNALVNYRTEQDRRAALVRTVEANRISLQLATDSYRKGITPFVTVLDAERQLAQTREQLAQSTVNVTTNLIAVYKSLGGGWQGDGQATAQN
ncbi:TolC family protein [Candidatus Burkholderia verschuerenii]|uniref:TolC family protein n=1 Tax=Candidatus Burkholderia verschuerenii TaxID=242163 RepID=UPI001E2DB0B3|nr:TolC family protein [Candidatus Burkholderia verschuerenii]